MSKSKSKPSKEIPELAKGISSVEELQVAYDGSYYLISGAGGNLKEWVDGYEDMLNEAGIGKPVKWFQTTGAAINLYAGGNFDPFPLDLTCLLFPLDGLDVGRLAIFRLQMQDRWFDDVIDNMRRTWR